MREEIDVGTDAYTQEELERAIHELERAFGALLSYAQTESWHGYRAIMRDIDLQYRRLRSQGPGLGAESTRQ